MSMTNLSEREGAFSAAIMSHKDELDACTTAQEVRALISNIIENDTSMKKSARAYADKTLTKLGKVSDLSVAWQIVYNVILAGDNCGCYWSSAAASRQRT